MFVRADKASWAEKAENIEKEDKAKRAEGREFSLFSLFSPFSLKKDLKTSPVHLCLTQKTHMPSSCSLLLRIHIQIK